ncbi:MAG: HPP family protein [Pseudomonas sp.]|uniref:HPP family protein n=1 Tax=Pseudomonas sp. TaxID=306 RepID=UPI00339A157B
MSSFKSWLKSFVPDPVTVSKVERLYGVLGAFLGLLGTEWFCRQALGHSSLWLIAPMGASAVLLFAVPSSPLAQPWSIIGGNTLSALIGVGCALWLGPTGLAAALAVALSVGAMFLLRCLHPPSGAVALTAVLGGPAISALGWGFVVYPVLTHSALLLLLALLFNMAVRRRYPHRHLEHANPHNTNDPLPSERLGSLRDDLNQVLEARGELLDISRDDLEEILQATEALAAQRRFGDLRCAHIMSRDLVTLSPEDSLAQAWALLQAHRLSTLPVVSTQRRLVGMLSQEDLLHCALSKSGAASVGEAMTTRVRSAREQWPLANLVQLLADSGVHHLPIVDEQQHLLGMVSQSDLLAALYKLAVRVPA